MPDIDDILDEYGFEDGHECSASPHGHHEWQRDWMHPERAQCFWCNRMKGNAE